ncbi:MAG: beta-galactosidase trimerization domain-containing protein [Lentisphaeria bacterium]|nr:beta-galactosidase trimerization domain-containing protein [Lentisphaeria bacterium]
MKKFKYALFYDFHTMATIPDVGKNFDAEKFTDEVKALGVDFLTWHARCNQGNAYYNTKFGYRHASLEFDMIRALGDCCRKKDITFSVYMNGSMSDEEMFRHREWMRIAPHGQTYQDYEGGGNPEESYTTPALRMSCYNSPFRDHIMNMTRELAEEYPVDGFFFDCLGVFPCICPHCVAEMKEKGINFRDEKELTGFARMSVHRFACDLNKTIREIKPDALLFFNGRPFEEVVHMESHLECECLPTAAWGYECLPMCAHYMRTVAGPDKCVLNMTGRFNDWGDFGGLRTVEGLKYDLLYGAANGMRPDIGGHHHPRGDYEGPVFDRIREVYGFLQQYDEWVLDAVNKPEVALVYNRNGNYYPRSQSATAAVRMLTELKVQFDLITEFLPSWDRYKLLIFPDDVVFTPEMTKRVEQHLKNGGKVLATSRSGLNEAGTAFAVKDWPVSYVENLDYKPLFWQPAGEYAKGIADMPLNIYAGGTKVKAVPGADVQMYCVKPYFNYGWDGLRSNYYIPPDTVTEHPFWVRKENVIYIAGEIFAGYGKRAPQQHRQLLGMAINALLERPKFKSATLPSYSRVFVQEKDNMELVHLLAYCPDARIQAMALEEGITIMDTELALRIDSGKQISKVYLAPDRKELPFVMEDGYCKITLPRFDGYALLVFE